MYGYGHATFFKTNATEKAMEESIIFLKIQHCVFKEISEYLF
jgi:hypothetical protein